MSDLDKIRAGRREANLRLLNERIADSNERMARNSGVSSRVRLVCECAHTTCSATIDLDAEQFKRFREDSERFVVVDGHVVYDVEQVVERGEGWVVVEKLGKAAEAARSVLE